MKPSPSLCQVARPQLSKNVVITSAEPGPFCPLETVGNVTVIDSTPAVEPIQV